MISLSPTRLVLSIFVLALTAAQASGQGWKNCQEGDCMNGGLCELMNPDVGLHACRCPPGTRGRFCEMTVAECGYPRGVWGLGCCANGGKCGILNTCECADGFTGPTCEIVVDQCIEVSSSKKGRPNHYCLNGGKCTMLAATADAICSCPAGFTGEYCEIHVQACSGDDWCVQGSGFCASSGNGCSCFPGFEGDHCEIAIAEVIEEIPGFLIIGLPVLGVVLVALLATVFVMYRRERSGNPLFEPLISEEDRKNQKESPDDLSSEMSSRASSYTASDEETADTAT